MKIAIQCEMSICGQNEASNSDFKTSARVSPHSDAVLL